MKNMEKIWKAIVMSKNRNEEQQEGTPIKLYLITRKQTEVINLFNRLILDKSCNNGWLIWTLSLLGNRVSWTATAPCIGIRLIISFCDESFNAIIKITKSFTLFANYIYIY